ncbi:bifunctional metallophosphatase/5'-nucleotidase [Vibrio parahaemolyticus]|uniref:bifunctional metallophosphatase/5'-nucleotidase n=1 Tax=Vibrio parahaemolyticus TaxID=670 RepID=UPI00084AE7C4|nr:bifunctional UDP-sugar hydrolase/5'-nucleotidase [Vibrio parahaemolyticus]EGR0759079.1 bifunctional metallophosphatase/5'-nucleotidase [Vibrio parahaemolyticus]EGR1593473.1 bifunctional metallophosphatase/5'-nucleotidase [Vibrio parahaemolyticus]EGR1724325.1 bifunctional metallophosphatase/5'-nucleotidase [Vibrio parahaemolyticus]EHK0041586.1 bifunctional metallophosphatase/5'-nucleotidase [Vibrio parahaemolyticus]EHR6399179.1 bifunctional metallophosphatase/5'-nucleotidase [Vibrio parahaem
MKTFSKKPLLYALAAFSIGVSFSSFAEIRNVTLLHTNDIESVYEPVDAFWNPDISRIGGIPYLATLIKQTRAQEETSFLFDAGDIFTGSLAKKTQGKLSFDLYSAMGYDAITLGNHEFEYGWQTLKENMPRAAYPVLNANIKFEQNNAPFASPYTIVERDGIRVGVIGVMGVDAFYNTMWKGNRKGLTIDDPIKTTQFWVDKIRDEVDMVVVLTHQNKTAPMQTDKEADPEVQRGFDEDYDMAGKLKGVDVIFGGHSDHGLWKPVVHPKTGTVISLTFGQGKYLGYTKFAVDTEKHDVKLLDGKLIPVESDKLERDKKTSDLIANARKQYPELGQQLATINDTAYRRYYRESNVGNLVADMMREAAKADVGMISSGSIRVDLNKGPVTMENVMDLFPFTDKLSVVKLNGAQLKELLEYSYTLPYGLAQFSGIEARYDNVKPQGQRLLSLNVNGKPVNDSQSYKVATYSYAASGGDGYHVFEKGTLESQGDSVTQVLIDQFEAKKDVTVPALGRQVDVSVKE